MSSGTLEDLDNEECMELLNSVQVGRVAVNGSRCPTVFPVNYAIDGAAITFRVREEVRREISEQLVVTFQADGVDDERAMAWSVMAQGVAEEMRDPGTIEPPVGFESPATDPWTTGPRPYWFRIVPQLMSGTLSAPRVIHLAS